MDKRALLLAAATKLFVERGLHATPTSAISKEAGVSAGILFHYFKTKEILIDELYISIKKDYTNAIFLNYDKITSDLGKLRLIWSNSWNWALENPIKYKFLQQIDHTTCSERVKNNPEIIAKYEMFHQLLESYIGKNLIKNVDSMFLMSTMGSLINGMVSFLNQFPEKRKDQVFIEQAWEMYYNYIKP
ncbi:MAG: TetR/AcrR family transcriptional regulator [Lutibacter sp.]